MDILLNIPWSDLLFITIGGLLILLGLIGCVVPVIPGPALSYVGLLMLQLKQEPAFSLNLMLILVVLTLMVTLLDYLLPIWSAKFAGASKLGQWGSVLGLIVGLFLPQPFGIILGPLFGALLGELMSGKKGKLAAKASFGVFVGFLLGTFTKVVLSGYMTYLFFANIF